MDELDAWIGIREDLGGNLMKLGFLKWGSENLGDFRKRGLNLSGDEAKGLILGGSLKNEVASIREAMAIRVSKARVWGNLKARI